MNNYFGCSRLQKFQEEVSKMKKIEEKHKAMEYFSPQVEEISMEMNQGELVEIKADEINNKTVNSEDDVIGVLSKEAVVSFTEENSLMVGYKND